MKYLKLLSLYLFFSQHSFAQTWADTVSLIEKGFVQYQPKMSGCQFSILRNGQIIYAKAWGLADLERNVPLTTNSVIEVGSVFFCSDSKENFL